jgi:hypothetical protein
MLSKDLPSRFRLGKFNREAFESLTYVAIQPWGGGEGGWPELSSIALSSSTGILELTFISRSMNTNLPRPCFRNMSQLFLFITIYFLIGSSSMACKLG